ncbi:MAG: protein kinase [Deltaproteobacteria bacterium]|nr:protein kinase [Deltaproteobacteria bacterium]MBW2534841.1 protein kinase [Deltaproteobacteria bacterium]
MADARSDKLTKSWSRLGIEPERLTVNAKGTVDPPPPPQPKQPLDTLTATLPRLGAGPWGEEITLREPLAEGGTAVVSLAKQASLSREVVVKEIKPEEGSDQAALELLQEGFVLGALQHPNVVPAHLVGTNAEGRPMLVLKRVEGTQWRNYVGDGEPLDAPDDSDDPLVWNLGILMQVCNAVHYAHSQGIIHRDIKPENVMIGEFGEVYLMDWGLAARVGDGPSDHIPPAEEIRHIVGTPEYMAPEMALCDADNIREQTDVYLLGSCLHELLTGYPPHDAESLTESLRKSFRAEPYEYPDDVPVELAAICRRAMRPRPEDRFPSADALRGAIARFLKHRTSTRLSDEAERGAAELAELLSDPGAADKVAIYTLFGQCRFGFRQALREWPENSAARRGLQQALEGMAAFELDRRAPDAASVLLADLPEPRPELEARVSALREQLAEEAERRELMEREGDLDRGKAERRRIMALICVLFAVPFFVFGALGRADAYHAGWDAMWALTLAYGALLLYGLHRSRGALDNQANRRFRGNLLMSFFAPALFWPLAGYAELTMPVSLAIACLLYLVVSVGLTLATHPKLLTAALPFAPASAGAVLLPDWAFEMPALALLAALSILAVLWRQLESYNVLPPEASSRRSRAGKHA